MFRYIRTTFLLLLLAGSAAFSQEVVNFGGRVLNEANGLPVPGHIVFVAANDSLLLDNYLTDQDGYFYDSLYLGGASVDYLNFATFDCQWAVHDTTVYDLQDPIFVEFTVCTDSIPGDCLADFIYYPSGPASLTIQFEDLSTGDYDQWFWDFGDSTFSQEQHPVHTYGAPGIYLACLTISSSNAICSSILCQPVLVFEEACEAGFHYVLDSLSSEPYIYHFTDQSTGEIESWFWDFGDGNISFEQNPVHQYADSGLYDVCLTVSNTLYPDSCFDTYCQQLTTPSYYDFGGLVWAGDYPLNNPVFTNDTGQVFLYRMYQDQWHFVESKLFHENGYYWFLGALEGRYLLKVGLTEGSTSFSSYIPTYFGDQVNWGSAQVINLHENTYEKHIHLVPVQSIQGGPGSITGNLTFEGNEPASIQEVKVILFNENYLPLQYTSSDAFGSFMFHNLPLGTYMVRADLTGRPSEPFMVILTSSSPASSNVELVVDEQAYYDIGEPTWDPFIPVTLYPNPARDHVNVDIQCQRSCSGMISICDISGKVLVSQASSFTEGRQLVALDITALPQGIYLLRIDGMNSSAPIIRKFIK